MRYQCLDTCDLEFGDITFTILWKCVDFVLENTIFTRVVGLEEEFARLVTDTIKKLQFNGSSGKISYANIPMNNLCKHIQGL